MPKILVLFNLRPDVSPDDYEHWARTTDIPIVNTLSSVAGFEAYRTDGLLGSEAKPPYQYFELVDVPDLGLFAADIGTETMKRVAAEFQALADNPVFILSSRIES